MLRAIFIYLSQARWARNLVTGWSFAWKTASRFVAGETLDEAVQVVKSLNQKGIHVTLDHLGEHTQDEASARSATEAILDVIERIKDEDLISGVSIKLTQIGLAIKEDLCAQNLHQIVRRASEEDIFIRIDMEDSPWVETTLKMFRELRMEQGFQNVGIVIQSYLYRSEQDVADLCSVRAAVRLCKGAYKEPPEIAYPQKADVDASFDRLTAQLIDCAVAAAMPTVGKGGRIPPIPAIATHDEDRVVFAKAYAEKVGLTKTALEFQMLHGIRRELQEILVSEGYPVRVYVPYGSEWYPYFMRRLAERPANLWFFLSNFFKN